MLNLPPWSAQGRLRTGSRMPRSCSQMAMRLSASVINGPVTEHQDTYI